MINGAGKIVATTESEPSNFLLVCDFVWLWD